MAKTETDGVRVLLGVSVTNDNPYPVTLTVRRVPDPSGRPLLHVGVPPYFVETIGPGEDMPVGLSEDDDGRIVVVTRPRTTPRPFLDFAPGEEIIVPAGQDVEAACLPSAGTTVRLIWRRGDG